MLTRDITERKEIPHEPGQWMVFRLLSWRALEEARTTRLTGALRNLSGVADVMRELQTVRAEETRDVQADPAAEFDRATLLRKSVQEWSYDVPVTPDALDDLDEQTAAWAAREIVGLHSRSETEKLNGFFRTGAIPSGTG